MSDVLTTEEMDQVVDGTASHMTRLKGFRVYFTDESREIVVWAYEELLHARSCLDRLCARCSSPTGASDE